MALRYSAGIIASVSTFARSNGTTLPWCIVNAFILYSFFSLLPGANIHEMSGKSCRGGHRRTHQVCAPALALASLKIAIGVAGTALSLGEAITVHADTHAVPRFEPLQTSVQEATC